MGNLGSTASTTNPADAQGYPMADSAKATQSAVWRTSLLAANEPLLDVIDKSEPSVKDFFSLLQLSAKRYPNSPCLGARKAAGTAEVGPFEWQTYSEVVARMKHIGCGLKVHLPASGGTVGIYSRNCVEWVLAAYGGWSQGLTAVPLYDTLGEHAVEYEINHAEIPVTFVHSSNVKSLLKVLPRCPTLRVIVLIDPSTEPKPEVPEGVTFLTLAELEALGAEESNVKEPAVVLPDELAFIMYTSGTTGDPKGAMLSHGNVLAACGGVMGSGDLDLQQQDRYLSYLPLAHIFETNCQTAIFARGGCVGFYQGDVRKLMDDITALKPTVFAGVPRIFQRVYDKAQEKLEKASGFSRFVFNQMIERERSHLAMVPPQRSSIAAKVFAGARQALGGEVRVMVSGAAPLPAHIHSFLTLTMGCPVLQGYGMTENCACATVQRAVDVKSGRVGPPVPAAEICLEDVTEMGYLSANTPPTGEVLTRGPGTFKGYFKNDKATAETLTPDGWLHTGDIGRINEDGTLSIIDRKKNIFKLLQGEYIAAEKIEDTIGKSRLVSQVFLYGHGEASSVLAVVVPNFEVLLPKAQTEGWGGPATVKDLVAAGGAQELVAKPEVMALIAADIKAMCVADGLKPFEMPKALHLEGEVNGMLQGFHVDNNCMTPTFKLRRPQLLSKYREQLVALYDSHNESGAAMAMREAAAQQQQQQK